MHALHMDTSQLHNVCTPIIVQPKDINSPQSHLTQFRARMPEHEQKMTLKHLNPSPATAKGHMKRPGHGIWSTTPKPTQVVMEPIPNVRPPILPLFQEPPAYPGPWYGAIQGNHKLEQSYTVTCVKSQQIDLSKKPRLFYKKNHQ